MNFLLELYSALSVAQNTSTNGTVVKSAAQERYETESVLQLLWTIGFFSLSVLTIATHSKYWRDVTFRKDSSVKRINYSKLAQWISLEAFCVERFGTYLTRTMGWDYRTGTNPYSTGANLMINIGFLFFFPLMLSLFFNWLKMIMKLWLKFTPRARLIYRVVCSTLMVILIVVLLVGICWRFDPLINPNPTGTQLATESFRVWIVILSVLCFTLALLFIVVLSIILILIWRSMLKQNVKRNTIIFVTAMLAVLLFSMVAKMVAFLYQFFILGTVSMNVYIRDATVFLSEYIGTVAMFCIFVRALPSAVEDFNNLIAKITGKTPTKKPTTLDIESGMAPPNNKSTKE